MKVCLILNKSENGKCNPILVDLTKYRKDFSVCVWNTEITSGENLRKNSCSVKLSLNFFFVIRSGASFAGHSRPRDVINAGGGQ